MRTCWLDSCIGGYIVLRLIAGALALSVLTACSEERSISGTIDKVPRIFPDYVEVTIPGNIAPLNFLLEEPCEAAYALFKGMQGKVEVKAKNGVFVIPPAAWRQLLAAPGTAIEVAIVVKQQQKWKSYSPFCIHIAKEPVDEYLAYRLIEPGYALWNRMGIYQRDLTAYKETALYENKLTNYNCVNCHSFCMHNPDRMLFHVRSSYGGTLLAEGGRIEKLNTKTDHTLSALVYPSWHPSGKYVAFSVNQTTQDLHSTQRVEVYDKASDVVIYDVEKHEIFTSPLLSGTASLETFPAFSADGKTLYYCSAPGCTMPDSINRLKYNLCSVSFDEESRRIGNEVDTLYSAREGKSVSFPRVSPDGKFLLCTLSAYGTFSIWHKDADLYIIDLSSRTGRLATEWNSRDTESYHSWSSNSRWVVFSSRRMDGLYTRPFLAYINEKGEMGKPFVLPQQDVTYYHASMKSFNVPEFIKGKVKYTPFEWMKAAKEEERQVRFSGF